MSKKDRVGVDHVIASEVRKDGTRWIDMATPGTKENARWTSGWNQIRGQWQPEAYANLKHSNWLHYMDHSNQHQDNVVSVSSGGTWKREEAEKDNVSDSVSIETLEEGDNNRKRAFILVLLALLLLAVALIPLVFHLIQTDSTEKIIGMFPCEVTLVRINYTRAMGDNSSQDFMELSKIFRAEISYLYQVNGTQLAYRKSRVNTLKKGSIVVQYDMFFDMIDGKLPTRTQLLDVLLSVERDLLEPNLGVLGDLRFKINSAKVEDTIKLNMNRFTDFKDIPMSRGKNDISSSESVDDSFVTSDALGTTDVNVLHEDSSEIATPENMAWGRITKNTQQSNGHPELTTKTVSDNGNDSTTATARTVDRDKGNLETDNAVTGSVDVNESETLNGRSGNENPIVKDTVSTGRKGLLGGKVENGINKKEESLLLTPRMTEILQYLTTTEKYQLKTLPIPRSSDSLESDTVNVAGTNSASSNNINMKTIDQEVKLFTFQNGSTINITHLMASSLQHTFDTNQTHFSDNDTALFSTTFMSTSTNTIFDLTTDAMNDSFVINSNVNKSIGVIGLDTHTGVHKTETIFNASNNINTTSNNASGYVESSRIIGANRKVSFDKATQESMNLNASGQEIFRVGILSSVVDQNSDKLSVASLTKIDDVSRGDLATEGSQPIFTNVETVQVTNSQTVDSKSNVEANVETNREPFRVNFNNFWPIVVDGEKGVTTQTDIPLTLEPLDNLTISDKTFNVSDSSGFTTLIDANQTTDGNVLLNTGTGFNLQEGIGRGISKDHTMVMLKVNESIIGTKEILSPRTTDNVTPNPSEVYIIGTLVPIVSDNADISTNLINEGLRNSTASGTVLSNDGSKQLSGKVLTEKSVLGNIFGSNRVNLEKKLYNTTSLKFADKVLLETIGNESYVDLSVDNSSVSGRDGTTNAFDYGLNDSIDIKKTGQSIGRFTVLTDNVRMTTPRPNMRLFVEELTTQILHGMNQNNSALQVLTDTKSEISKINVSSVVTGGKIDQTFNSTSDVAANGVVSDVIGVTGQSGIAGVKDVSTDSVILHHSKPTLIFEQTGTESQQSKGQTHSGQMTQIVDFNTPNFHKFTSPSTLITANDLGSVPQQNNYIEGNIAKSGTSLDTQNDNATKTNFIMQDNTVTETNIDINVYQTTDMSTPISATDGFITSGEILTSNESFDLDRRQSSTTQQTQDTTINSNHRNVYILTDAFGIRVTTGSGLSNEESSYEIQDTGQLETTSLSGQWQITTAGKFIPMTTDFVNSAESIENNVGSAEDITISNLMKQPNMFQSGERSNIENITVGSLERTVSSNNNITPISNYAGDPTFEESIEANMNSGENLPLTLNVRQRNDTQLDSSEISNNGNETALQPEHREMVSNPTNAHLINSAESNEQNMNSAEDLTTLSNYLLRYSSRVMGSGEIGSKEISTNQQALSSTTDISILNSAESIEENFNSGENVTETFLSAQPSIVGSGEASSNENMSTTQRSQIEMMSIARNTKLLNSMESIEQNFGSGEFKTTSNPTVRINDSHEMSINENMTTSKQTQSGIMRTTINSGINSAESFEQGTDSGKMSTSPDSVKEPRTIDSVEVGSNETIQPRLADMMFGSNSVAPITTYADFSNSRESLEQNRNSGEIMPPSIPNTQPYVLYFTPPVDLNSFNVTSQNAMVRGINIPTYRANMFGGTSISSKLLGINMDAKLPSIETHMTSKSAQGAPLDTVGKSSRTWTTDRGSIRDGGLRSGNRWHTNPYSTTADHHDSFEVTKSYTHDIIPGTEVNTVTTRTNRKLYPRPTVMRDFITNEGQKTITKQPNNNFISSSSEQDTASTEIDGATLYSSLASSIPYTNTMEPEIRTKARTLTKALDQYDSTTRPLVMSDRFGTTGSFGRETRYTGDPYYYDSTVGTSRTPMFSRGLTTLAMRTSNPSSSKSRLLTSIGPRMTSTTLGRSPFRQSQELFGASNFISPWLPSTRYKLPLQTGQVTKSTFVANEKMVTKAPVQTVPPKPGFNYLWSLGKDVLTSLFQGSSNVEQPDAKWKNKPITSVNQTSGVSNKKVASTSVQFKSMHGGQIKPREEYGAFDVGGKVAIPLREMSVTTPGPKLITKQINSGLTSQGSDSKTVLSRVDFETISNLVNSGVILKRLAAGTMSNRLDSNTVPNQIKSLDSGSMSNSSDSGKKSNVLDSGTVSNGLNSIALSKKLNSGSISTSRSSKSSTGTRKSTRIEHASSSSTDQAVASVTATVRMNAQ